MTRRQSIVRGSIAAGVAAAAWLLFFVLPRWTSPQPAQSPSAEAAAVEGGRRINASLFYVLYLFRNGWQYYKMGYAAALAWVLLLIMLGLTMLTLWASRRMVYYEYSDRET